MGRSRINFTWAIQDVLGKADRVWEEQSPTYKWSYYLYYLVALYKAEKNNIQLSLEWTSRIHNVIITICKFLILHSKMKTGKVLLCKEFSGIKYCDCDDKNRKLSTTVDDLEKYLVNNR